MPSTLLLADDSVTIQRVIELTFANEDVRVVTTGDGQAAIQRMDAAPPDIVLADVGMPGADGYTVASHVKQTPALQHIPVLLLTGAFEPIDEGRARACGCDGVLVKPFEPQQLVGRVKELLAGTRSAALWPVMLPRIDEEPVRPELPAPAPIEPGNLRLHEALGMEETSQQEFDELDAAFAQLDSKPAAASLDEDTASDFARDLDLHRSGDLAATSRTFGDWDLPSPPPQAGGPPPVAPPAPAVPPPAWGSDSGRETARERPPQVPEPPPTPPEAPGPAAPAEAPVAAAHLRGPAGMPKVSMAGAFAALLAAEQSQSEGGFAPRSQAAASESTAEEIARRVLARMTDDAVRRLVLETAERLIKEEIAKIRANPD